MNDLPTHAATTGGGPGGGGPGPTRELTPGAWVGSYQVVEELGRGGMGVVLKVRHSQTGHEAALKLILGSAAGELALARFGREAQALAKVQHRNVIRVFELGRAPQGPYLVMELVEGVSLEALTRTGPLEADRAVGILIQLCDALSAVHGAGILHRDLKPENVVQRPDGTIVLLDFGVAHDESAEQLTQTGQLVGTPSFMSPEQAAGERSAIDQRSDVYGLGAILFTLLNGSPPFQEYQGKGQFSLIWAVLKGNPTWPRERQLPQALVNLTKQALSLAPTERPASADAFKCLLETYLAEGDRGRARRPILGIVAGALVVLGLVAASAFAVTRDAVDPTPSPPAIAQRPADLDERIAALGLFSDEGFRNALAALASDPAYTAHLQPLREGCDDHRELVAALGDARLRGAVESKILARLRAYLLRWPDRPESVGLRSELSLLSLAAKPLNTRVLKVQHARLYGGACLDPAGEQVLAIGYRDNPSVDWRMPKKAGEAYFPDQPELTDEATGAQVVPYDPMPQPLVAVAVATGQETILLPGATRPSPRAPGGFVPLPTQETPPSLTGYVAAPGGGAWLGIEQVAPVNRTGDAGARVELWAPGAKAPTRSIGIPGLPGQDWRHLATGVGQTRILAIREQRLAVGMGDGRILVLNLQTEEAAWVAAEHKQRIMDLEFLEDGRLVSASGRGLKDWQVHPGGEVEDMRVILWSAAGEKLRTYTRVFGSGSARMPLPRFCAVSGTRLLAGTETNRVVVVIDLEAPDDEPTSPDSPGGAHRLLRGKVLDERVERGEFGSHEFNWSEGGPEPRGGLWLTPERALVWGDFSGRTELRVFEVPQDRKLKARQILGWVRPDRVEQIWLSPDRSHLLISSRSNTRPVHNRIERRRLIP